MAQRNSFRYILSIFEHKKMSSPELETLDQLLDSDMSLRLIRQVYPDDDRFLRGVRGLLDNGDVTLKDINGVNLPGWKWRELLREPVLSELWDQKLSLTDRGAKRIT